MKDRVVRAVFAAAVVAFECGSAWADIPASAYVQDGLVTQFDGIENAGAGSHNGAATIWTDLSGNGRNGTLSGSYVWLENGLQINSVSGKGLVAFNATHNAAFTFDICLKVDKVYGAYARITAENATPAMCCYGKGSSLSAAHPYVYGPKDDKDLGTTAYNATVLHTSTLLQSGTAADGWDWYHDGALLAQSSCAGTSTGSSTATLANNSGFSRGLDGVYYAVRIYNRALTADDIAWNAKVDKARFSGGDPNGYSCDVEKRSIKTRVRLQAKYGTEMSFDGETWDTSLEDWVELGSPVTVQLRVPEGKVFSWGELPADAELSDDKKTLTFTGGVPVEVVAQVGETITWNNHADTKTYYWDDPSLWTAADGTHRLPTEYDRVVIPDRTSYPYGDHTIIVTNPIPRLHSLYLGTRRILSLRNGWDSKIEAESVIIKGEKTGSHFGTTLNCAGGFTEDQMSNRVWIVAESLIVSNVASTISAGGYGACNGGAWHDATGMAESDSGSHGGRGTASHGHTYGSITEPTAPGSGSWRTSSYKQNGGGAVRIQAKRVVNNGSINATGTGGSFGWGGGGGSGGSIYISCDTIEGTGSVNANGGGNTSTSSSGAGGGGRVAVHYDTEKQKTVDCQVAFAARGGCDLTSSGARYTVGYSGTLYFPDDQFLKRPGRMLAGWVYYGPEVTLVNSLVGENLALTNSLVELTTGAVVNVSGNLSFVGTNTRVNGLRVNGRNTPITVGGDLELEGARLYVADGSTVSIGGDLTQVGGTSVHDSGEIYVKAAPTNGVDEVYGATLDVGELWRLGANTIYYPVCNPTNGSIVAATAGSFEMAATAAISGNSLGWAKGYIRNRTDYFKKPVQPGTGTGSVSGYGLPGGGVVRIDVRGNMVLDGTISANGEAAYSWHYGQLPSPGGSVYLSCDGRLSGTGTVKANGGNAVESADKGANAGRIAIYYRMLADDADITAVSNGGSYRKETERSSNWGADYEPYWRQWHKGLRVFVR